MAWPQNGGKQWGVETAMGRNGCEESNTNNAIFYIFNMVIEDSIFSNKNIH